MRWFSNLISRSLLASIGAGLLLAPVGCGQSEYDQRMNSAKSAIDRRAQKAGDDELTKDFVVVRGSDQVSKGMKLRLPACFGKPGVKPLGEADPLAKVPGIDIPGLCYSLEARLTDENNKQVSCYCYMYGVAKATATADQIREKVKAAMPAAQWSGANNKVMFEGSFDFNYADGSSESRPGVVSLQMAETADNVVVVGFRFPKSTSPEILKFTFSYDKALATMTPDAPAPAAPAAPAAAGNPANAPPAAPGK